ncbi:hypothetical protein SRABI106_04636 [Rahnella aquatilis]|nr:hypothetical protein SRABI106_04636 [Rahnella aquatilis]
MRFQALNQIRVRDIAAAKCHGIDITFFDQFFAFFCGVSTGPHNHTLIMRTDHCPEFCGVRFAASPVRFGDMQVSEFALVQFIEQVDSRLFLIFAVIQPVEGTHWRNADAHTFSANSPDGSINHFQRQTGTVFNAAAVFIFTQVGRRRHKLMQQIAVRGMQFDVIETSFGGAGGSMTEIIHDPRNFAER